jgi:hypothetical protein
MSGKDMVAQWAAAGGKVEDLPGWTEREVVGGDVGELLVRKDKERGGVLVTADSLRQVNKDTIKPGETRRMVFTSCVPWTGKSFSVSSEHAHLFVLRSVQCGRIEYVPDEGVPCTLLSDAPCLECRQKNVRRYLPTSWPVCLPGTNLTIDVENVGDQPSHFRGTFEADLGPSFPLL